MDTLNFYLRQGGETLLLIAVDPCATETGDHPCRVVGRFTAENPPAPAGNEARISRLLTEIGVPRNLLGCAYLRTGLALLLAEPALGRSITRRLYPRIAQKHAATVSSVERAIRHAIAQTFSREGGDGYRSALGRLASCVGDKPTNSEFFAQAAEWLRIGA